MAVKQDKVIWFYLPRFSGELSSAFKMRGDYLFKKIHFRKVLLCLWTHNVTLLHYSYYIANHFIQLVTHVESLALFCNLWPQVTLQTRPRYCHQVTRLFNSKYEMWIPVFDKTVPKWLYLKYVFWFLSKKKQTVEKNQISLPCLGNPELNGKNYPVNSTCPVGQVLLGVHSSEIKTYLSWAGRQVEVLCSDMYTIY